MLPYLKPKRVPGVIISTRKPDGSNEMDSYQNSVEISEMETCAEDLIRAIHSKDSKGVAMALKAAFELVDSMPHEEGPHTEKESE